MIKKIGTTTNRNKKEWITYLVSYWALFLVFIAGILLIRFETLIGVIAIFSSYFLIRYKVYHEKKQRWHIE